jgi:hypothetical protein
MSFAIYGESDTYVFLVSAETKELALTEFIDDVASMGVKLANVYNVYAVNGRDEFAELENQVNKLIKEAQ